MLEDMFVTSDIFNIEGDDMKRFGYLVGGSWRFLSLLSCVGVFGLSLCTILSCMLVGISCSWH